MSSSGSILGSTSNSDATRSTVNTPASDAPEFMTPTELDSKVIEVAPQGDVVLRIEHENKARTAGHSFRASSKLLAKNSKYFERLLRAGRFSESSKVEAAHDKLTTLYGSAAKAPSAELPILDIKDVGRISNVKALDALLTDLLHILHDKDAQIAPSIVNYANLAIVADRFDALDVVRTYFSRKKLLRTLDGRTTTKTDASITEEKTRQRLLAALLLDYPLWVEKYSALLITKGWLGKELDSTEALWWDLPMRVEEELGYRRECILETIQSVQAHFLGLYTSRERQCRLGYDNSTQCDSFQLGEFVKFTTKFNTLRLQGTIAQNSNAHGSYDGDLYTLVDLLRQVPEYQIDKFHSHCGVRTRLIPLLDLLQQFFQYVGICLECWRNARAEYAWIETKPPLLWTKQDIRPEGRVGQVHLHSGVRSMFTAGERRWN